jgi:anti-sigma regulatory factor (Ser/Thr protein kinase)
VSSSTLIHDALFYSSEAAYVEEIGAFVQEGLVEQEAVLVAVPGAKLTRLRAALGDGGDRVEFVDMMESGRNPARILPLIKAFVDSHPARSVRFVGEPIWAGRTAPEIVEGVRHEALINELFARTAARILCPYDAGALDAETLEDARRTHPTLVCGGEHSLSAHYVDPRIVHAAQDRPLPEPSAEPVVISLTQGLVHVRSRLEAYGRATSIDRERLADFVLGVNEAAANVFVHADGRGEVRVWHDERELVCEVSNAGRIGDALAGRRVPNPAAESGRGLWILNQLCDLVELRSGDEGTVIRAHMELARR